MRKIKEFFKNSGRNIGKIFHLLFSNQYYHGRINFNGRLSMTVNFIWAGMKFIFGLVTVSYFFWISALYSLCVGFAKYTYFKGRANSNDDLNKENEYYARMAIILFIASIIYVIYMIRLFFYSYNFKYEMIPSIGIAAVSFAELGVAIFGLVKSNKKKDLLLSGFKSISLASALISIVLTQVAILSFADAADNSKYNAISGCIFGGLCILITLFMLHKSHKIDKKNNIIHP